MLYHGIKQDNAKSATLLKYLGDNPNKLKADSPGFFHCLYLDAAGIYVPALASDWSEHSFESLVLHSIKTGKLISVSRDGEQLVVKCQIPEPRVLQARTLDLDELREKLRYGRVPEEKITGELDIWRKVREADDRRFVTFTLDPQKGYAVVRRVDSTPGDKIIQTITCEDFEEFKEKASMAAATLHD